MHEEEPCTKKSHARRGAMHGLSIAMSIVEMAQEEAEQRHGHVTAVRLKLGALSGVVKSPAERLRSRAWLGYSSGSNLDQISFCVRNHCFVVSIACDSRRAYDAHSCHFHLLYQTIDCGARSYRDGEMCRP